MLNFDMVGSPNFARFVYDGEHRTRVAGAGAEGLGPDRGHLPWLLPGQGLASEPTAFDGRSDYGPFIAAGIPAGGLFTGAEETRRPDQAPLYGGIAGKRMTRATT